MPSTASFQVLCRAGLRAVGVLRVHPAEGEWEDRSDFSWSCTMVVDKRDVELWGANEAPTFPEARAIHRMLKRAGMAQVSYEIKGKWITHRV